MLELLAPAGTMEALYAAVNSGADAVYLGMSKFGARAYATNFNYDTLPEAIRYCHLNNVKLHVTMNTIIFENELDEAFEQIMKLYELGVDAVIIQDIALMDYLKTRCPQMEGHASTQMGLDDTEGALQAHEFGATRVVLGRECSLEQLKKVKLETGLPVEAFGHGALCVSYSGNCLMSGLLGYRSGNRGRCVGSCRKPYELINTTTGESLGESYILSTKDLATVERVHDLDFLDSLKIEGRMKEPTYVANVVRHYRYAIDHDEILPNTMENLSKTFNRTFTKGYIFGTDKKDITKIDRPNHNGYYCGFVSNKSGKRLEITLEKTLHQNDMIRIESKEEVNMPLLKIYDSNDNLINSSSSKCYIYLDEKISVGDKVFITKDINYYDELDKSVKKLSRRQKIDFYLDAHVGKRITLTATSRDFTATVNSEITLEKSNGKLIDEDKLIKQLDRLGDSVYEINHVELSVDSDAFIPTSVLNELRRNVVEKLDQKVLKLERNVLAPPSFDHIEIEQSERGLSAFCTTKEQYDACVEEEIDTIYFENFIRRNEATYNDSFKEVLVGGYGGIRHYSNSSFYTVSDFSLNVVNSRATYLLHKAGVNRVTISHELNKSNINDLINAFKKNYSTGPNLEMIVYGHAHLLNTKYCPLKVKGLCGKCKTNRYVIKDNYGEFPIISHQNYPDCTTTLVNGKCLNLLDEIQYLPLEIRKLRLQFTIESKDEVKRIIKLAKEKLNGSKESCFNSETDTRGHFNREIL